MTLIPRSTIDQAARALKDAAPDATVILFGSYARGDARPGSDLDFMVVEPKVDAPYGETGRLMEHLYRTVKLPVPVDVIVASRNIFEEWKGVSNTVYFEADSKGQVLYA